MAFTTSRSTRADPLQSTRTRCAPFLTNRTPSTVLSPVARYVTTESLLAASSSRTSTVPSPAHVAEMKIHPSPGRVTQTTVLSPEIEEASSNSETRLLRRRSPEKRTLPTARAVRGQAQTHSVNQSMPMAFMVLLEAFDKQNWCAVRAGFCGRRSNLIALSQQSCTSCGRCAGRAPHPRRAG
jgi:hypothetical protein